MWLTQVRSCSKRVALFVLAAVCVASQVSAYPLKVTDARGRAVAIKARPARIVSLAPNITEILYAIGAGDQVAAVTKYCNYPPGAAKKPKVGDVRTTAEAVLAQKPDLVIAHAFLNATLIAQLETLHKTVFAMNPRTISQTEKDILALGRITDHNAGAAKVVAKMQRGIAEAKKARAGKKMESVMVVIQSNPLWVAGPNTFIDEMLRLANAKNIAWDARSGFVTFSRELAVSRRPSVIVVGSTADQSFFLTSPIWRNTPAAKSKRVYVINNDLLVRPGPRLADGLTEIVRRLNRKGEL